MIKNNFSLCVTNFNGSKYINIKKHTTFNIFNSSIFFQFNYHFIRQMLNAVFKIGTKVN